MPTTPIHTYTHTHFSYRAVCQFSKHQRLTVWEWGSKNEARGGEDPEDTGEEECRGYRRPCQLS